MEKKKPQSVHDLGGQKTKNTFKFEEVIRGPDFDKEVTLDTLLQSFMGMGIQASNIYKAIEEIKRMRNANAKIFLGATSNMISCGNREIIKYICKNKFIDVFCATAGGIEEDIIKCFGDTLLGQFDLDGKDLREQGWNRIGNMVIHNDNYFKFELFMNNFFDELVLGKTSDEINEKYGWINLIEDRKNLRILKEGDNEILTPEYMMTYIDVMNNFNILIQ